MVVTASRILQDSREQLEMLQLPLDAIGQPSLASAAAIDTL